MTTSPRFVRALRAALLAAAAASTVACGNLPTAPAPSASPSTVRGGEETRSSGYMLSSGRDER